MARFEQGQTGDFHIDIPESSGSKHITFTYLLDTRGPVFQGEKHHVNGIVHDLEGDTVDVAPIHRDAIEMLRKSLCKVGTEKSIAEKLPGPDEEIVIYKRINPPSLGTIL